MKMSGTSRRSNVETFQHRDVPTSRRPNVATLGQLLCRSTSSNVATSQRHDVSTLRSCNIATSMRMLFSHHLKENRRQNLGYRETYGLGAEIRAATTSIWKKSS